MRRREFLYNSGIISTMALGIGWMEGLGEITHKSSDLRLRATEVSFKDRSYDISKRIPLGWKSFSVSKDQPSVIIFDQKKINYNGDYFYLRISSALDFRENVVLKAYLPESRVELGVFDIKYSHPFQPFEIKISDKYLHQVLTEGIGLSLIQGNGDIRFYDVDQDKKDNIGLQPHLLMPVNVNKEKVFFTNLYSMNSFSPFGWLGGSVQDALLELHLLGNKKATSTLIDHLGCYLHSEEGIIYENTHTQPTERTFNSIEDLLPFAAITYLYPDHISINLATDFFKKLVHPSDIDVDAEFTTEGCYTLAYPMAAIANKHKHADLGRLAISHLVLRMNILARDEGISQRSSSQGKGSYKNWGRGVAWYLLGIAKSVRELNQAGLGNEEDLREVIKSYIAQSNFALSLQNKEGMYYSYIDNTSTGVDTSATAGIAASFAWGYNIGLLDREFLDASILAYNGLMNYISEDGFLREISQINRGGEDLQKNGYRVMSQFGLGLLGQLYAAIQIGSKKDYNY